VFGGCFDAEFASESIRFFDLVRHGRVNALVSPIVLRELVQAPPQVRALFRSLPRDAVTRLRVTVEAVQLAQAYVATGFVSPRLLDDAMHVALATVARADAIVSWNFRDIVRVDKMRAYNSVNLREGFGPLTIVSPQGVHLDEPEQD
jgi:predicted nucleic acid-binding protein